MAYALETCAECKMRIMATDGVISVHHSGGTKLPCDGSGEFSLETEERIEDEPQAAPSSAKSKTRTSPKPLQGKRNEPAVENEPQIIPQNIPPTRPQNGNGHLPLKIEKGIPIPKRNSRQSKWDGILRAMDVSDSFLFAWKGRGTPAALLQRAKALEIKLTVRRLNENEIRVWRVK